GMDLNWRNGAARVCALAVLAVLVLLMGATAQSSKAAASGLVAQYSFDEGSGTAVADSSGNGNNGTIQNGTWSTAGKYRGALQFNGSSTLVSIPDAATLDLTNGMTLEAWVNASSVSGWKNVLFKQQPKGMVYSLYAVEGNGAETAQVNIGGEQNAVNPTAMPA